MSVYDWIETRVPGGHASRMRQLLDVACNIEYGAETTDQSALNLVYLLGYQPKARRSPVACSSRCRSRCCGPSTPRAPAPRR